MLQRKFGVCVLVSFRDRSKFGSQHFGTGEANWLIKPRRPLRRGGSSSSSGHWPSSVLALDTASNGVFPVSKPSQQCSHPSNPNIPDYYRQVPPAVPNFMATLFRRKIVLWFLASEILRDYWLSGPYGRNWAFLWSSPIPKGAILALIIVFFVFVWALLMFVLTQFAKVHTWLLPVFAVGLGAPRWCQVRCRLPSTSLRC